MPNAILDFTIIEQYANTIHLGKDGKGWLAGDQCCVVMKFPAISLGHIHYLQECLYCGIDGRWFSYLQGGSLFVFDKTYRAKIQVAPEPKQRMLVLYPFGKCRGIAMRDLVAIIDDHFDALDITICCSKTGEK
jgi:hypothetical protein